MLTQQIECWRISLMTNEIKLYRHDISNIGTCHRSVDFSRYSNNITDCHDIAEILLNGELNTIIIINHWLTFFLYKCTDTKHQRVTYLVLFNCTDTRHYKLKGFFFCTNVPIENWLLNLILYLFYDDFRQSMATSNFPQIVYLYGRLYRYDSEYWLCFV